MDHTFSSIPQRGINLSGFINLEQPVNNIVKSEAAESLEDEGGADSGSEEGSEEEEEGSEEKEESEVSREEAIVEVEDSLEKGEIREALHYDSNLKFNKTGKEIKEKISAKKVEIAAQKATLEAQLEAFNSTATVKPFQDGYFGSNKSNPHINQAYIMRYPWLMTSFRENGVMDSYEVQESAEYKDHLPTSVEEAKLYRAYNNTVEIYVNLCEDLYDIDFYERNLVDGTSYELRDRALRQLGF